MGGAGATVLDVGDGADNAHIGLKAFERPKMLPLSCSMVGIEDLRVSGSRMLLKLSSEVVEGVERGQSKSKRCLHCVRLFVRLAPFSHLGY